MQLPETDYSTKPFVPSEKQTTFFQFIADWKNGSCNLIAVAGSGKSTSILRSLPFVPSNRNVLILAFNKKVVDDMKEKFEALKVETGQSFANVRISTAHSYGFGPLRYALQNKGVKMQNINEYKSREIFEGMEGVTDEVRAMYSTFVCQLVAYAKGYGVGISGMSKSTPDIYQRLIDHHNMELEAEEADVDIAIDWTRKLMSASVKAASQHGIIDFDDMLFLPLLWNLRFFGQDIVYMDEAQDTNPVRREIVRRTLRGRDSRVIAVGDPKQAIYGFTGATNDAMDAMADMFDSKTLYLNVSYRCPQAIVASVKKLVPYFEVHESNEQGDEFNATFKEAMECLTDTDVILCRNVAPIVSLAFKIIGTGRACHVLGSEIGKGLVKLVKKMKAVEIEQLRTLLAEWLRGEVERLVAKGQDKKAQGKVDQVECLYVMIDALPIPLKTIDGLLNSIESLFRDGARSLCLSSIHKSKGREWNNVVIYAPELMPSKWARQEWELEQELNLEYVARTRTMNLLIFMAAVQ